MFAIPLATFNALVRPEDPLIAVLGRYHGIISNAPALKFGHARVKKLQRWAAENPSAAANSLISKNITEQVPI